MHILFFFKIFGGHESFSVRPLIPLSVEDPKGRQGQEGNVFTGVCLSIEESLCSRGRGQKYCKITCLRTPSGVGAPLLENSGSIAAYLRLLVTAALGGSVLKYVKRLY